MPHKCMRCGAIYSDEGMQNMKACPRCGGKFFIYAKTAEELMGKEELKTEEEKLLGISGEIEVKRIGDRVIITKVGEKKKEEIPAVKKKEVKQEEKIIEKEEHKIPYIWDEEDYRRRISAEREKISVEKKAAPESKEDKGLIQLKTEKPMNDLEWLEAMFGGKVDGVVSFDIETLKILRSGAYEIDIAGLMSDKPLILSPREGTFYIDLQSAMLASLEKKKKKENKE